MRVCVFVGSSAGMDPSLADLVQRFGAALAGAGNDLVYGGTDVGLMRVLAEAVRDGAGHVTGVVPARFEHLADHDCDELVVTDDLATRKVEMVARSDGFVALPGGYGTLDELLEVVTLRQLGFHELPIVVLGPHGFWDPLEELFASLHQAGFVRDQYRDLVRFATTVTDALELLAEPTTTTEPKRV